MVFFIFAYFQFQQLGESSFFVFFADCHSTDVRSMLILVLISLICCVKRCCMYLLSTCMTSFENLQMCVAHFN